MTGSPKYLSYKLPLLNGSLHLFTVTALLDSPSTATSSYSLLSTAITMLNFKMLTFTTEPFKQISSGLFSFSC